MSQDDPQAPEYTDDERSALTRQYVEIATVIQRGDLRERRLDVELLRDLHRALFRGVRSHAGRMRAPGSGSEVLVFGRCRSLHRDEVLGAVERLFQQLRPLAAEVESLSEEDFSVADALRVALWAHVEVIRIHPFEDGNGRTARNLLSLLLVRFGLRPIAIEAPKAEYITALDRAFEGEFDLLMDLYRRLAEEQLGDDAPA